MKKATILFCFLYPLLLFGQDTAKMKLSKFEEFSSEDGILLKFESRKIGKVKGFAMYKRTVTNIETEKFYNAVEITEKSNFWGLEYGSIIIDEDEIPSVIKTLKYYLVNVVTNNCKEECPSYGYETNGGVHINCSKTIGAYGSSWHIYISKSYYTVRYSSIIDLDTKELESLIKLLELYK